MFACEQKEIEVNSRCVCVHNNCSLGAVTWLPTAQVCVHLGWVKCREYISLLVIIIVYVTNKKKLKK